MNPTEGIRRPRLMRHVLARAHLTGSNQLIVLYDTEQLRSHRVSRRTWVVLAAMDGTRDIEGIVAYARLQGADVRAEEVADLVSDLAGEGMIAEGNAPPPANAAASNAAASNAVASNAAASNATQRPPRAIRPLPGFLLDCNGSGTCCRFYPSIAFSELDAARARAALPDVLGGGADPSRIFLPLFGAEPRAFAVALVDGRCAYLEKDLGCGIHRASGAKSKPLGCRTYPARFIDDGSAIRVLPWLECACVFTSAASAEPRGEPLIDPALTSESSLDPAFHLERLPERVPISTSREAPLCEVVEFCDALLDVPTNDAVLALVALAQSLDAHGLDAAAARAALTAPPSLDAARADLGAALAAMTPALERLASEDWRSPRDMVRLTATALHQAALLAKSSLDELLEGPGTFAATERFYVRALLYGLSLVHKPGKRPMSLLARDRAARALLGRSLAVVAALANLEDPAFAQPLALVEATMRGYGVSAYIRDLAAD